MKLSTAAQLVVNDLRNDETGRYVGEDIDIYREWTSDGPTVAEIDEAERGRQLTPHLAEAYRTMLRAGPGPVRTVLCDTQDQADHVDTWFEREAAGVDVLRPARAVIAT